MRRAAPRPSGVGSFLLVLGFLTILAVAFGAGVGAGRRWPRLLPSLGGVTVVKADRQDGERGPGRLPSVRSGPGTPELTFYNELTAPLTAPPPASKPKPERGERGTKSEPKPEKSEPRPEMPKREARSEPAASASRFTIQVGAYKTREQAEAVQSRLVGAGYDAYIADLEGPPGTRFRVRVGTFTTRDEARPIAERLAAERKSPTYVTTR